MAVHERTRISEPVEETAFVDELQPGTPLMSGQYVIRDFLNAGGFGITYLATDSLDRTVVIKECFPGTFCRRNNVSVQPRSRAHQAELRSIVRLFANEAHSLAKVGHPNIVGVHHVFEENNTAYMALDFVNGRDLLDIIEDPEAHLTPAQIRTFLEKMLEAIGFVHREGMLHRDISPDNIIVRKDGEPILIDFGAAREQATKASRVLSALRVVKDGYSPQEFYITGSEQSPSCDLYSLAASFYHVITGDLPPDSQRRLSAFASSEQDPYVPLGQRTGDFDPVFCAALDKAMSVLPKERMQSAEEWLATMRGEIAVEIAPAAAAPATEVETLAEAPAPRPVVAVRPSPRATPAERPAARPAGHAAPLPPVAPTAPIVEASEPDVEEPQFIKPKGAGTLKILVGSTALIAIAGGLLYFVPSIQGGNATAPAAVAAVAPAEKTPAKTPPKTPAVETAAAAPARAAPAPTVAPATAPATATAPAPAPAPATVPEADPAPVTETIAAATPAAAPTPAERPALNLQPFSAKPGLSLSNIPATVAAASVPRTEDFFVSRPVMPFSAAPADPALIGDVLTGSPEWAVPGLRVVSLDGGEVASLAEAIERAGLSLASDAARSELVLGVAGTDGATVERRLTVPVEHDLNLPNGLGFRTRIEDGAWVTRVTRTAAGTAFAEGDVIVADVSDNTLIDGPDTLMRIVEAGVSDDTTSFTLAVRRGEELYVETFQLTAM